MSFISSKTSRGSPIINSVALAAPNEEALLKLEHKLIKHDVAHIAFREPDMDNELTAIGISPEYRSNLRKFVSNFPLIK